MLRHFALQSAGCACIRVDQLGSHTNNPFRKLGLAGGQHQREKPVGHQITQQTGAIRIKLAPAEEMIGVERDLFVHRTQPGIPIDVLRTRIGNDAVIPFAVRVVPVVIALRPNRCANLAVLNPFCRPLPRRRRTTLRARLVHLAGLFHRIMHLEYFRQIPGHGLLAINMFARFHRVDGDFRMPDVVGGNDHRIDILALQEFLIVVVCFDIIPADDFPGVVISNRIKITHRHLSHVVLGGIVLLAPHVRQSHAGAVRRPTTNPHIPDCDSIVRANHASRGRGLVLAVNRGFQYAGRSHRRSGCGRFLDEIPA